MGRIAIIGTGISGLGAAYLLHPHHEITVYEDADRIGGHARTIIVPGKEAPIPVDTGFIVFNERNYPRLRALFAHLGVAAHKSNMSFAATIDEGRLEWGAQTLGSVFGQRRNIADPRFHRLIWDVMRFNRMAPGAVEGRPEMTLRDLIAELGLGAWFRDYYILPMGAAIWSCPARQMLEFPAAAMIRFFSNHGLLSVSGQPQWYTVTGGSRSYIERLTQPFKSRIRTSCGATHVSRHDDGILVRDSRGETRSYDHVVFAAHADDVLRILDDPTPSESDVLSRFAFQENRAVLHSDPGVMPKRKACWASWVYRSRREADQSRVSVSYWMNRLQGIDERTPLFVTLNPIEPIREETIHDEHIFHHPVFDKRALEGQSLLPLIQGKHRTWFCGAYWRYGFHEDGFSSGVDVALALGAHLPWEGGPPESAIRETCAV